MKKELIQILKEKVLLADGAMGTYLLQKGLSPEDSREFQNIINPDLVFSIHKEYINSGAEIIETNTFAANSIKLRKFNLENRIKEINEEGVLIARKAAGENVFVGGSVGPLGVLLRPYGIFSFNDLVKMFKEQMIYLIDAGVDFLIIETISSLLEARAALLAAKSIRDIPVIVQMTFTGDGKTKFGDDLINSLDELKSLGADGVGVNCTIGPKESFEIITPYLEKSENLFSIMPNAGYPTILKGKTVYLSSSFYFKEYASLFLESGANIIGSCCGTTPEHTKAMAEVVLNQTPRKRKGRVYVEVIEEKEEKLEQKIVYSRLKEKLGKEIVYTVEIDPPKGLDYSKMLRGTESLSKIGIDAVNIADNPMARMRMSSIALAHLLQEKTGIEAILHFTCRDRNLLGIQSELLGASALGIRAILALRGDPAEIGDFPKATSVFDIDTIGLIKLIKGLNQGKDLGGNSIGNPTSFFVGVAVNPSSPSIDAEIRRFEEKVEAGADFALTQPQYDEKVFEKFISCIEKFKVPIILGILPLRTSKHAEFLHNEVPGISIPERIREKLRKTPDEKQPEVGKEIISEFIKNVKGMISGFYFMPPFENFNLIAELIEKIKSSG
ncbi:MAG: bifunctional homocysteine S-methyltransferase/methylenetetrahydrofolate reductase [Acidobacteriota bacterium]